MNSISVVIITFNEEQKIGQCLDSVKDIADEIIVVDSHSTDATEAICDRYGVKFFNQDWLGYSDQKNLADDLATCDLIFSIDADEAVSDELKQSIKALKNKYIAENEVFAMNRLNNYCGQWVKGCGLYPETKIRIWRRDFAEWEGIIHEWLNYKSEPKKTLLQGDLLHYSYYEIDDLARRQPRYYQLAAQSAFDAGRRAGMAAIVLKPCWTVVRDYLLRGGFRDGRAGYILCRMNAHYTFMKYTSLLQKCSAAKQGKHQKN